MAKSATDAPPPPPPAPELERDCSVFPSAGHVATASGDVPLRDNPMWADVTPIPQDDGPNPITPIMYSPEFTETMDYFRAVLKSGEISPRAFHLSTRAIKCNAANYTAWHFRRKCIDALGLDLATELAFVSAQAAETPKNYQVWYHRRAIVQRIGAAPREFEFTRSVFDDDAKNYHAWAHRQWVLTTFGEWDGELAFVDSMLEEDVRNNSAWNQRWFVIHNTSGFANEIVLREIEYTLTAIRRAVSNESAWSYLRGLLRGQTPAVFATARAGVEALLTDADTSDGASRSVPLQALLAELHIEAGDVVAADAVLAALETTLDDTRARYWKLRRQSLADDA
eukprot:CAMPEP_0203816640 /NCGR_PEP_ID=MMETSP0115-20131106/17085_1 /ASSEMBLY_ACC=CAM_ASM_000227 /TAXON_ID=33651 /ORGANISM="Bicosoecid sp, Strain ms1" /LENGTH=338 /DNA_ID=CAMNT_0050725547 /DNA_START=183 /DNA_END=1196 /DNA_ORIENTATION=-